MTPKELEHICYDCPDYGKDTGRCKQCRKTDAKPKKDYWKNICEINRQQTEKGIKTYGQRLEDNIIPNIDERIRYLEEELVDALKYLERIKDYLKDKKKTDMVDELKNAEWIKEYIDKSKKSEPVIIPENSQYKWHDLRKNPSDLPEYLQDVICCLRRVDNGISAYFICWNSSNGFYFQNSSNGFYFQNKKFPEDEVEIIGWKYIEPFGVKP